SANAGEVSGIGEDVGQIHRQRIGRPFAELERRYRRSRRDDRVHFFECFDKVLADEFAHFLSADVVSVVVTGTQYIVAETDPAFYFGAETFLACPAVMIEQIFWIFGAITVSDAVEPGEVRGRFRGREEIINSDAIVGVRQANIDNLRAERL